MLTVLLIVTILASDVFARKAGKEGKEVESKKRHEKKKRDVEYSK